MAGTRNLTLGLVLLVLTVGFAACGGKKTSPHPAYPESNLTYAISHFMIPLNPENPVESMEQLLQTIEDLREGDSVLQGREPLVPQPRRPHPGRVDGVPRIQQPDALTGAFQAVLPGEYGGPIQHEGGVHFVYRHTFDEGRQLEEQRVVPAYGFFLQADEQDPAYSAEESELRAKEAWGKVSRGELTLAEAGRQYGAQMKREDAFLRNIEDSGPEKELYAALAQLAPGEMAPPTKMPGAFLIARRGVYFRSHVRHILIQHVESANRPLTVSRSKQDAKALAEKIHAELTDGSLTWTDAVHRNSDDIQTIGLQGWIGAPTNGDLIPEFERVILATEPGSLASEVLDNSDGLHILYRVN